MDSPTDVGKTIPEELNPAGYKTLPDVLANAVKRFADRPAFSCMGKAISYRELDQLSAAFACYLQQETDLQPGDRIAIQLPNLLQYPIALFGAMRAGLIVVNTNPLYTPREMKHQFKDAGARALVIFQCSAHHLEQIIDDTELEYVFLTRMGDMHPAPKKQIINFVVKFVKKLEPAFNLPGARSFVQTLAKYAGQTPKPVEVDNQTPAVLQYTGGTTGISKGAMLTHVNLISNMMQSMHRIKIAGDSWSKQVISPLPLYHIYAFTIAQCVLEHGGQSVLIPNPRDIPGFVKALKTMQPTTFLGLNTLFVALCRDPHFDEVDFSNMKLTSSGGVALTHDAAEQWKAHTGCTVVEGYGLTETSPVVSFNPPGQEQIGSIGLPMTHTEVKIIDPLGNEVADGETGELCVRGPQVMLGYWQNEQATRDCMTEDGFFRTGDIALRQPDGYLKIVDRAKDMIIVSGFNVYPNEVEDIASAHPDIVECAAVGIPHAVTGETVKLYVVRDNNTLTEDEIKKWCKKSLSAYKVPHLIEFRDELPKSNVGKVLRRHLKEPQPEGDH